MTLQSRAATQAATLQRQYVNTTLAHKIIELEERAERIKAKYVQACIAASTLRELADLQREHIEIMEAALASIVKARTIGEAHRLASEAA